MDYKALLNLSYGLYVVTSAKDGIKAGYIANTVFQVTSSPPQIAISCHKNNHTLQFLTESGVFSVSILKKETSPALIGEFGFMSGAEYDKFAHVKTVTGSTGAPVLSESCVAWLDCRVVSSIDLGSHVLFIGQVVDCGVLTDEEPLTYAWYREKYKMYSPKNAPTYIEKVPSETEVEKKILPDNAVKPVDSDDEPYICTICGHIYRPEEGDPSINIPPGTSFSELPEDFRCPICNAGKDYYKPLF
jgi:flavin reductase (DIM6/NTAB) family NADH-FMN oxidoreductase RutF/rubredoxin